MPYARNADLPQASKTTCPRGRKPSIERPTTAPGKNTKNPASAAGGGSGEEAAQRVAWAAVKQGYVKRARRWVSKA